ncbi:MAG TPA: GNAT family N-acetyltransferase [Acidimicrobiales bacterium]|jgi:GNAT superfamily N-acetyltransferase
MLELAFDWRGVMTPEQRATVLARPEVAHYIDGWGRRGDLGVVADNGAPLGAAWIRRFTRHDPGYGYVDDETPELSIGVVEDQRGRGLGTAMLHALVERALGEGATRMSLSVEDENPARRLYERLGFDVVGRVGSSDTMILTLRG